MKFIIRVLTSIVLLTLVSMGITAFAYDNASDYLTYCKFTTEQSDYIISKSKEAKDPDHYIKRIGAIAAHEQGKTFVDGETKYFAGRLKKGMEYKDFQTQVDGRTDQYNRLRYTNKTATDWINRSHYCVSDTHGGGKGCPNRVKNVPSIAAEYKAGSIVMDERSPIVKKGQPKNIIIKTICREQTIEIQEGEYLKITYLGKLRIRIKNLRKGDSVQVCHDLP